MFFQVELNVLGMVIYGTELALWIGIFVCGGFLNFAPWVQAKLKRDRARVEAREASDQGGEQGGVAMHRTPSSTSVFRTPCGVLVERNSIAAR